MLIGPHRKRERLTHRQSTCCGISEQSLNFTLRFDFNDRVLLVTLGKVLTKEIALEVITARVRFINEQGPCSGIFDFSAVEGSELDAESIRSLAATVSAIPILPAGKLRILIAPGPHLYGLSRMFQILRDEMGSTVHVVHSLEEAFALLGLKSTDFLDVTLQAKSPAGEGLGGITPQKRSPAESQKRR